MDTRLDSQPSVRFEVEKVLGVSSNGTYQVQWAPAWVSKFHLVGCEHLIREFLEKQAQGLSSNELIHHSSNNDMQCTDVLLAENASEKPSVDNTVIKLEEDEGEEETMVTATENTSMQSGKPNNNQEHDIETGTRTLSDVSSFLDKSNANSVQFFGIDTNIVPPPDECSQLENHETPEDHQSSDFCGGADTKAGYQHIEHFYSSHMDFIKIEDDEMSCISDTLPLLAPITEPVQYSDLNNHNPDTSITADSLVVCTNNRISSAEEAVANHSSNPVVESNASMNPVLGSEINNDNNPSTYKKRKSFVCTVCGKPFPHKSNLLIHMRTHTGLKPYRCEFCEKSFNQSHHLKDHLRIHTNERPYLCHKCGKSFKTTGNCKSHVVRCKSAV